MTSTPRQPASLRTVFDTTTLRTMSEPQGLPVPPAGSPPWGRVDAVTRSHILDSAREALSRPLPVTTLSDWLDFTRTGGRHRFEGPYFERRRRLAAGAMAQAIAPSAELSTAVLDGVWQLVEEDSWCIPAHLQDFTGEDRTLADPGNPRVDLFAAETGALVATVLAVHGNELAQVAGLPDRLRQEVRQRVLDPFQRDARQYFWFGQPANWNPWIMSNVIACAFECAADADSRAAILGLTVESLDRYLDGVPPNGGCDEGIMYWWVSAARLFEALELLVARGPAETRHVFTDPLIAALARYPRVVELGPAWAASFGDGSARIPRPAGIGSAKDMHPLGLLHRYARAVGDDDLAAFAWARRGDGPAVELPVSLLRGVRTLLDPGWADAPPTEPPPARTEWLPDVQVFAASAGRLRLVAKGGSNGEPHNHNDVGSFVVAVDGDPVLIDAGTGRYTRDSFRAGRYDAWFTTSPYHSVPWPGGAAQPPGVEAAAELCAVRTGDRDWRLELELAGAYPADIGLRSWRRRWSPDGEALCVEDTWTFDARSEGTALHLLLAREPLELSSGRALLRSVDDPAGRVELTWDEAAAAAVDTIELDDELLRRTWGERIARLRLTPAGGAPAGALRVRVEAIDRF